MNQHSGSEPQTGAPGTRQQQQQQQQKRQSAYRWPFCDMGLGSRLQLLGSSQERQQG